MKDELRGGAGHVGAEVHLLGNATGLQTGEDGTVLGFADRDPFDAVPLAQSFTVESRFAAMSDAPLRVALPFDLWKITLRTSHASQFYAELAPYEVTFAQPYAGVAAGETMTVADNVPLLSPPDITEQFFFLPLDDQVTTIAATTLTGETQTFSFDGHGVYEIGEDGVPHRVE